MSELPPLGDVFGFMRVLWELEHELQRASRQLETTVGITSQQRLVLRIVERFPGILAGQLAQILHLHPSTLTGILQRIEKHGLLRRREDPRDRRRTLLGLTAKGKRALAATVGAVEQAAERTLHDVDPTTLQAAVEVLTLMTRHVAEPAPRRAARRAATR